VTPAVLRQLGETGDVDEERKELEAWAHHVLLVGSASDASTAAAKTTFHAPAEMMMDRCAQGLVVTVGSAKRFEGGGASAGGGGVTARPTKVASGHGRKGRDPFTAEVRSDCASGMRVGPVACYGLAS
jgi:hypothetical protein